MIEQNHECYVSLEVAKLLKRAGFNWKGMSYYQGGIFHQYSIDKNRIVIMNQNSAPDYMEQYSAPTLDVAQRWLREVKEYEAQVAYGFDENGNKCYVTECGNKEGDLEDYIEYFPTYEEAKEAVIKKALKMILEK